MQQTQYVLSFPLRDSLLMPPLTEVTPSVDFDQDIGNLVSKLYPQQRQCQLMFSQIR